MRQRGKREGRNEGERDGKTESREEEEEGETRECSSRLGAWRALGDYPSQAFTCIMYKPIWM